MFVKLFFSSPSLLRYRSLSFVSSIWMPSAQTSPLRTRLFRKETALFLAYLICNTSDWGTPLR